MSIDASTDAYLARIGVTPTGSPDLATLRATVAAHARTFAFENLSPFVGREVDLDPGALAAKFVAGGRGGYCFEHNTLLRCVLDALGYRTTGLAARVLWGRPPEAPRTARGHMLLHVDLPEGPHVVDVGFGGLTLTGVLRLDPDEVQETPHEPYRLHPDGGDLLMQALLAGEWRSLYRFDLVPHYPVDYEVASWYLSHHPASHFVTGLTCARPDTDRRHALGGRSLATHHLGGPSERRELSSPAEIMGVLEDVFLLDLAGLPELETALKRLF